MRTGSSWRRWPTLGAWRAGARPAWRRVPFPYTPERTGLLSMLALVVVFGIHSLVDWTWYVPGDACVALLCAGWLAGRGEIAGGRTAGAEPGGQEQEAPGPRSGQASMDDGAHRPRARPGTASHGAPPDGATGRVR